MHRLWLYGNRLSRLCRPAGRQNEFLPSIRGRSVFQSRWCSMPTRFGQQSYAESGTHTGQSSRCVCTEPISERSSEAHLFSESQNDGSFASGPQRFAYGVHGPNRQRAGSIEADGSPHYASISPQKNFCCNRPTSRGEPGLGPITLLFLKNGASGRIDVTTCEN